MRIKDADAEIILAHICGKPRTWIVAHEKHALAPEQERQWAAFRKRRERGEPVAYITGEKEFFGRSFHVDRSVLIPRPSTEGLVEMVLALVREKAQVPDPHSASSSWPRGRSQVRVLDTGIIGFSEVWNPCSDVRTIVDIGTGSGCIAVTLARELPEFRIIATDISAAALAIARKNAERHGVGERIRFLQGNLFEPIADVHNPFLLISNPPYIPEGKRLPHTVEEYEPPEALRAGPDGLAVLRPLLATARSHPACRGFVVECRADHIDEKTAETDNTPL